MYFRTFSVCVIFLGIILKSDGSRILGLFTSPSKSHLKIHMSIVESLVRRGHELTVITTNKVDNINNSFRHIQVKSLLQLPADVIDSATQLKQNPFIIIRTIQYMSQSLAPAHNESLSHPKVQELMENESFDLVILGYFFNDLQLGIAAHFKCPIVLSWTVRTVEFTSSYIAQPHEVLYVPTLFSSLQIIPLSFIDRIRNVLYHAFEMYMHAVINEEMEKYYQYNFPPDKYPSLDDMRKNISLILTNHHFSEGPIYPTVPALVQIGGIQIKEKPDPLPSDIQKFADDAKDGVIFFSFGSNYPTSKLKPHIIQAIISVFSKLKQRVLMKWETDSPPGNSPNILFRKWLPQDDILVHPNVKLFITHGGRGSIAETQYHGVPIIGVPLFSDQMGNVDYAVKSGFGIRLNLNDLNEKTFLRAIKEVLDNSVYRDNIKRFSNVYRDRPMTARETAVYWIEYVIRHRGAKHMQSPAVHMSFIQYYGLDIVATIAIIVCLLCKLFIMGCSKAKILLVNSKPLKGKVE